MHVTARLPMPGRTPKNRNANTSEEKYFGGREPYLGEEGGIDTPNHKLREQRTYTQFGSYSADNDNYITTEEDKSSQRRIIISSIGGVYCDLLTGPINPC
eukprot:12519896-Heterocapsa_arctica.AAC.1